MVQETHLSDLPRSHTLANPIMAAPVVKPSPEFGALLRNPRKISGAFPCQMWILAVSLQILPLLRLVPRAPVFICHHPMITDIHWFLLPITQIQSTQLLLITRPLTPSTSTPLTLQLIFT